MTYVWNLTNKSWSCNKKSKWENYLQDDRADFWPPKLTLKTGNVTFLAVHVNQKILQDFKKFF